jgi:hypothetical protein
MNGTTRTVAVLAIGVALGYALSHRSSRRLPSLFQPSAKSADEREPSRGGELWLSDFESEEELKQRWETRQAVITRAEEHVTHGRHAAKVTFEKTQGPAIKIEDAFDKGRLRDWRRYDLLSFDLYNAQPSQERVILQIKDADGRVYKEDIFLSGKSSQRISIRLEDLKEYLNLGRIAQLDLFRWKPRRPSTFYLDAVRLSSMASSGSAGAPSATPVKPAVSWQVAWATSLVKLTPDPEQFEGHREGPIRLSLARGEYESAQVVLIGGQEPAEVTIAAGALTREDGAAQFPSDVIEIRRVGYVETVQPYYPAAYIGEWPDPLPLGSTVEVPSGRVQPVWLTIGAPESLPAGRYTGSLTLTDAAGRTERLALEVRVRDFTLPRRPHLKTAFDFYRSRLKKAYEEFVPGGQVWNGRTDELEDLYFQDMLKHRIFPVMSADPTSQRFWRRIGFYRQLGLGAFGIGTRGGSNGNNWPEGQKLQQAMGWYREAAQALRAQGLLQDAYIYTYDEPKPGDPRPAQVMQYVHWADPGLRNLLVMHEAPDPERHADWLKDADILCIRIASYDPEHAKRFRALGKEMWMYVSSPSHPFPALVIDYPAIAHRILPWMAWKYEADGLLYWCVNYWKSNPWEDAANFAKDQNGNGSLYYPSAEGPVPSIRIEVLRDGMEDYEYLYLLRELIQRATAAGGADAALLERAGRLAAVDPALIDSLRSYAKDPQALLDARDAVADMIEQLQALFAGSPVASSPVQE